ncbi:MAG: metallophosphoesterase family protein [Steroidobacteraceae bacterium]
MELPAKRKKRMTGWYDPGVMARSAIMLATANIFGRHSDTRLIEALGNQPQSSFDYSDASGDFTFDFVADLGDGWDATFAVAEAVANPQLEVEAEDGTCFVSTPGDVLVFGGDLVYPYPSRERYALHTEAPYALALAQRERRPDVFAIPGNHDWFDSLVAFSRSLCRPERGFAGCRTRQTRSYFALKLPQGWWLLGVDLQLGADLDEPQVRYFQAIAREMKADDRYLLCVPEPQWIYEHIYADHAAYQTHNIEQLEQIIGRRAEICLTGDLHYYRRHSAPDGRHKVIAGGGGAFLHPTHQPDVRELQDGFVERACYPDVKTSRRLGWRNLLFPIINPRAAWLTSTGYAFTAWLASSRLDAGDLESPRIALESALRAALREPVYGIWLFVFVGGLLFFTDTHSRVYRVIGGGLHAVAHLLAAFLLAWLSLRITVEGLGLPFGSATQLLVSGCCVFIGAALVGPWLIGFYLFVSLQLFGRHSNEAFSALRIVDYKHWLRLVIDAAGNLSVLALGIDRVGSQGRKGSRARVIDRFSVLRRK